MERGDVLN